MHGHNDVVGTTRFPHQIGLGSSFDPAPVTAVQKSGGEAFGGNQRPPDDR